MNQVTNQLPFLLYQPLNHPSKQNRMPITTTSTIKTILKTKPATDV